MNRSTLLLILLLICGTALNAQRFSYVYIQGDKQTPFYVKLDGAMQPRYGKNYCILPQLAAGTINLEILFQQNAFPAQPFTIQVPENGSRAFMLVRRDGAFSLYDLQQQFYLTPGNKAADDHLPSANVVPITASASSSNELQENETSERTPPPARNKRKKEREITIARTEPVKEQAPESETAATEPIPEPPVRVRKKKEKSPGRESVSGTAINKNNKKQDPEFLDVTLANDHAGPLNAEAGTLADGDTVFTQKKPLDITFRNSDCPQPMPDGDFERIYKSMMQQEADEDRVAYLNGQLDKCYQSWQARTLGSMLSEDAARFTFLKNVYPHITDQQAFPLLDDMLRSEVWKAQFLQLTHR